MVGKVRDELIQMDKIKIQKKKEKRKEVGRKAVPVHHVERGFLDD